MEQLNEPHSRHWLIISSPRSGERSIGERSTFGKFRPSMTPAIVSGMPAMGVTGNVILHEASMCARQLPGFPRWSSRFAENWPTGAQSTRSRGVLAAVGIRSNAVSTKSANGSRKQGWTGGLLSNPSPYSHVAIPMKDNVSLPGLCGPPEQNGQALDRSSAQSWITDELVTETQRVWSTVYRRAIPEDEAREILVNVKRLAEAVWRAKREGSEP